MCSKSNTKKINNIKKMLTYRLYGEKEKKYMEITVLTQELKNKEFATQLNKLKTKINSVKRSNW